MIDLLDLYIHHLATTHVGPQYALQKFMNLQIGIRRGLSGDGEDAGEELIIAQRDMCVDVPCTNTLPSSPGTNVNTFGSHTQQ